MKPFLRIKDFISKLQNLPTNQKMIILWSIVIIFGVMMGYFWIKSVKAGIENINTGEFIGQFNLPLQ